MNSGVKSFVLGSLGLIASALVLGFATPGCGGDDDDAAAAGSAGSAGSSGSSGGSSGSGGSAGFTTCDERPGPCYPKSSACGVVCESKCQARADYSKEDVKRLRMSQLKVTAPTALASALIQKDILHSAIYYNSPECLQYGEKGGTFNWLFEVDVTTGKARTGGAKPVSDVDAGYCFVSEDIGNLKAEAVDVELDITKGTDGSFDFKTKAKIPLVVVPIYLDAEATKDPILLPLRGVSLTDGTLSENGNCIGRFRGETDELDPASECRNSGSQNDPNFFAWENAAKLDGYITMEEADEVIIVDVGNTSLCGFLTGHFKGEKCAEDNFAEAKTKVDFDSDGDGTNDSFSLKGDFSASATNFATATGDCKLAVPTDHRSNLRVAGIKRPKNQRTAGCDRSARPCT